MGTVSLGSALPYIVLLSRGGLISLASSMNSYIARLVQGSSWGGVFFTVWYLLRSLLSFVKADICNLNYMA